MKQTTNYQFNKPELTDSPPDITVFNPNFDVIDAELKERDTRVGPLTSLLTRIKTSIVNSLNGLQADIDEHKENNTHIPKGLISMWSGLISAIPNGWALCDGTNGTPNLKDRFIMGATTDATINKTGGENAVTLTENQMPAHNHTGSTGSSGSHSHIVDGVVWDNGSLSGQAINTASSTYRKNMATNSAGAHSHTISIGNTGGGQAHENRPAYYTLAFIMKV